MEPIWVLSRCYRIVPNAACHIVGVYSSAGSAIAEAEESASIDPDSWKKLRENDFDWQVETGQYAYKLEHFMIPTAPVHPLDSIEVDIVH